MTKMTIELSENQDLAVVEESLHQLGLKFSVDEDEEEWGDLPGAVIESI